MISDNTQTEPLDKTTVSGSRFVPMLFSTPMVQAILNGIKTETRRIIDVDSSLDFMGFEIGNKYRKFPVIAFGSKENCEIKELINQKLFVNDIIWVRETFRSIEQEVGKPRYEYKATENINLSDKWKPSLFMPKDACRIFLKCVSVHVEKLQYIDEQSAINEGIEKEILGDSTPVIHEGKILEYKNYFEKNHFFYSPIVSYSTLWAKINGWESWNKNPFVWVYKFVKIDAPDDFR